MSAALNTFDRIASLYDLLARIVFGGAIHRSQLHFLGAVGPGASVLILGGGSGALLRDLLTVNPTCRVCYIEASSAMLDLAARKVSDQFRGNVSFIHGTEDSVPGGTVFDAIITNFFLDLFNEEALAALGKKLDVRLRGDGLWLVSDFVDGKKRWQRLMLWIMYRFFAFTCNIGTSSLPAWEKQLEAAGMKEKAFATFFDGFIKSAVYGRESRVE